MQWGGLALIAELWVALVFVRWARIAWELTRPELTTFAESVNRISQLKSPAFKYPASGVYLLLFVLLMVGVLGWLAFRGIVEAMAPERDSETSSERPD
ncbi:MAG TPA: hypothetical protein VGL86_12875 [Polyangia bacterium]